MPRIVRRRRRSSAYEEIERETMTLAVSFEDRAGAEQATRDLGALLRENWDFRDVVSTPHAVHAVVVLVRDLDKPKGEKKSVKKQIRKRRV